MSGIETWNDDHPGFQVESFDFVSYKRKISQIMRESDKDKWHGGCRIEKCISLDKAFKILVWIEVGNIKHESRWYDVLLA